MSTKIQIYSVASIMNFRVRFLFVIFLTSIIASQHIKADDDTDTMHVCFTASTSGTIKKEVRSQCSVGNGTGMWLHQVKVTQLTDDEIDKYCCKMYEDDEYGDYNVDVALQRELENDCNGKINCSLNHTGSDLIEHSNKAFMISYECIAVDQKNKSTDVTPVLSMRTSKQKLSFVPKAVLSMKIDSSKEQFPINRTCTVDVNAGANVSVKFLHVNLRRNQKQTACVGQLTLSYKNSEIVQGNCSFVNEKKIYSGILGDIKLSIQMLEGFVWLQIDSNKMFNVSCARAKSDTVDSMTLGTSTNYPGPEIEIQPEPGRNYSSSNTTDGNQGADSTGQATDDIIIAVIVIAGVIMAIIIVITIYLCKTRNSSPYRRWKDGNQVTHGSNQANQNNGEYSTTHGNAVVMYSSHSNPPADHAYSDVTMTPPLPAAAPPSQSRPPLAQSSQSNTTTFKPVDNANGGMRMDYSDVIISSGIDDIVTTTGSGLYSSTRTEEPCLLAGSEIYDVMGQTSGEYAHFKTDMRENYLLDNPYDG